MKNNILSTIDPNFLYFLLIELGGDENVIEATYRSIISSPIKDEISIRDCSKNANSQQQKKS